MPSIEIIQSASTDPQTSRLSLQDIVFEIDIDELKELVRQASARLQEIEVPSMLVTKEQLAREIVHDGITYTVREALIMAVAASQGEDTFLRKLQDCTDTLKLDDAEKGLLVACFKLNECGFYMGALDVIYDVLNVQRELELQHSDCSRDGSPLMVWVDFYETYIEVSCENDHEDYKFADAVSFAQWLLVKSDPFGGE